MSEKLPILYSFRRCPYAMRARLALAFTGQSYELREILLTDKPAEMLEISPKGTVPVLQLPEGRIIDESLDIVIWALERKLPEGWVALSSAQKEGADSLFEELQESFMGHLTRYKYPERYDLKDGAAPQQDCLEFLEKLNDCLEKNEYLCTSTPCYADLLIFSFVRQFRVVDQEWFDTHVNLPKLLKWFTFFQDHPLFEKIMEKHEPWLETRKISSAPVCVSFP